MTRGQATRGFTGAEFAALFFFGTTVGLILARFDFLDWLMAQFA